MKDQRLLLLYKISTYQHLQRSFRDRSPEIGRFYRSHQRHYASLKRIESFLKQNRVPYNRARRGQKLRFADYDVIITIGGDGTFLEAGHQAKGQTVLGINSDPQGSVGKFCSATAETFSEVFAKLMENKAKIALLNRLSLKVDDRELPILALNDVLFCHANPAAMSHYDLQIGMEKEEQRSSGIWISTAAGSTGAIRSAGGRVLKLTSKSYQYLPREIYPGGGKTDYHLTGGTMALDTAVKITSLMRDGVFFVDGSHLKFPLSFGQKLVIRCSGQPLRMVKA